MLQNLVPTALITNWTVHKATIIFSPRSRWFKWTWNYPRPVH